MKRDMVGYGRHAIPLQWPNEARIAINFVVNYKEAAQEFGVLCVYLIKTIYRLLFL